MHLFLFVFAIFAFSSSGFGVVNDCLRDCLAVSMRVDSIQETDKNVMTFLSEADGFRTFVALIKAADLAEALKGDGRFTIFAPTDEAFLKLPKGMVSELLEPESKGRLVSFVKRHIVAGEIRAADFRANGSLETMDGSKPIISMDGSKLYIGDAKVVRTNFECTNGVIHVLSDVMSHGKDQ